MAVYTKLEKEEINNILLNYKLGKLKKFEGIKEGIENTNKIMSQGFDKFGRANVKDNNLAEDALQYSRIACSENIG